MNTSTITLHHCTRNAQAHMVASNDRFIEADKADYLPHVLEEVRQFLCSAGFSIDVLIARTAVGDKEVEHSSRDVE